MDNINIKLVTDDIRIMISAITNMCKTIKNCKSNLVSLTNGQKISLLRSIESDFRRTIEHHDFNIFVPGYNEIKVAKEYIDHKYYFYIRAICKNY